MFLKKLSLILIASVALSGCAAVDDAVEGAKNSAEKLRDFGSDNTPVPEGAKGTALAALQKLPVKGRAPMTGYDRDQFGSAWDDNVGNFSWSNNGCDTRNDVLKRDLTKVTYVSGSCDVATGVLPTDPYSGETNYVFDSTDDEYATDLDIEHVVALGNAWVTGAQQLTPEKRAELANDPLNLMAVNPSLNRQKSDGDFATWLPPNKNFRCSYAARQIRVKTVYKLWVTKAEKAAMEKVLATCPNEPLAQPDPQGGTASQKYKKNNSKNQTPTKPNQPKQQETGVPNTNKPKQNNVTYANCDAVRAAGAAPIRKGDPGYSSSLDRDGDGVGCE